MILRTKKTHWRSLEGRTIASPTSTSTLTLKCPKFKLLCSAPSWEFQPGKPLTPEPPRFAHCRCLRLAMGRGASVYELQKPQGKISLITMSISLFQSLPSLESHTKKTPPRKHRLHQIPTSQAPELRPVELGPGYLCMAVMSSFGQSHLGVGVVSYG